MTANHLSEAEQDRLLLDIYEVARRFAVLKVREEDVDDVVHDIAADCLVKFRTGAWTALPSNFHGYMWKMVKHYAINHLRRSNRRDRHDAEHYRDRTAAAPAWISPVHSRDDEVIHAFQERMLDGFSAICRTAYLMVRDEGLTYMEVAEALHISAEAVHHHVSDVRRAFRAELRSQGIDVPYRRPGGEAGNAKRKRKLARFAPRYVPPAPVPAAR